MNFLCLTSCTGNKPQKVNLRMCIVAHLKAYLKVHKNTTHPDNPICKVINDKSNLSHEHLTRGSTYAPQMKLDASHLYLNKSMYGGPGIVKHQKPHTSTLFKAKLTTIPI